VRLSRVHVVLCVFTWGGTSGQNAEEMMGENKTK